MASIKYVGFREMRSHIEHGEGVALMSNAIVLCKEANGPTQSEQATYS